MGKGGEEGEGVKRGGRSGEEKRSVEGSNEGNTLGGTQKRTKAN